MHISYKPLWHTLIERNMRKEDLRLAAGLTTNMIANMGKEGKHISMDTLARICETLDCGIMDVIELASHEDSTIGGNSNEETEKRIIENGIDYTLIGDYYYAELKQPRGILHQILRLDVPEISQPRTFSTLQISYLERQVMNVHY